MHLLRIEDNGDFSLVERQGHDIPQYAILSHTWFKDEEEVNFQDVKLGVDYRSKSGYSKLQFCAQQAAADGFHFFWVDTCCIDKTSSAELAEAINSMFRWYQNAAICYAFLSDVTVKQYAKSKETFRKSRWFTRGWTLQELIAPALVQFYSLEGERLGDKQSMVNTIYEITGIPKPILHGQPLSMYTAGERMSWAKGRDTKREEDAAYSLLGLFNVYMPPIYGEGREHAFVRLWREIRGDPTAGISNLDHTSATDAKTSDITVPKSVGYEIPFSLKGVPLAKFVDRPRDLEAMGQSLLPIHDDLKRRMLVIHGLGGAGKTQLAAAFARRHQHSFSSVFWVNGGSKNSLKQGIANCASRIANGEIAERSRTYALDQGEDLDAVIRDMLRWLSLPENGQWLLIVDNVDRDHRSEDPEAYDIEEFLPEADHGSVLITTRLPHLGQLGEQWEVKKVDMKQARAIFETWYGRKVGIDADYLLELLDGLPLALAQAAAYMSQVGINAAEYTRMYRNKWRELMDAQDEKYLPLKNYVNGTVATTWIISFSAIKEEDEYAANLLLLWAHLDNRSLWYEMIAPASRSLDGTKALSSFWLGNLARSEIEFMKAIGLLRRYSLVEDMADQTGYATHPVVHQWAHSIQTDQQRASLLRLAIIIIGTAVPREHEKNHWTIKVRLLPHADCCVSRVDCSLPGVSDEPILTTVTESGSSHRKTTQETERTLLYRKVHDLGDLYNELEKLDEAERLYMWSLKGLEDTLGSEHSWTLKAAFAVGDLYATQGKMEMADKMIRRVMEGRERIYGKDDLQTLHAVSALAYLYQRRGQLGAAEEMYTQALGGFQKAVGLKHEWTLNVVHNFGILYHLRGRLNDAENMYKQALHGREERFGLYHPKTLESLQRLANLYMNHGRSAEAEPICIQVLEGYKTSRGPEHSSTLRAVHNLGALCWNQGKFEEAETHYKQALEGFERFVGHSHVCTFQPLLDVIFDLAGLCYAQHRLAEARAYYIRALAGYEEFSSGQHPRCELARTSLTAMDEQEKNDQKMPRPLPSPSPIPSVHSPGRSTRGQEYQRGRPISGSTFDKLKTKFRLRR